MSGAKHFRIYNGYDLSKDKSYSDNTMVSQNPFNVVLDCTKILVK